MYARHWQVVIVLVTCLTGFNVLAAEISAFSLIDFGGELALRYLYDEQTVSDTNSVIQSDNRSTYQQELKLSSSSYVYHPYLLNMDISGGLLLNQIGTVSSGVETSTEDQLVNLDAKFNFLEKKPYPITLYYNQQNPSVTSGVGGRFIQENIRYGIDAAVMEPVSPVLISLKAFRQTSIGEGFDQIVDDEEERVTLRLYSAGASGSHMELTHQESQLISSSGSLSSTSPITARETSSNATNFTSRNLFGRTDNLQFTTNITRNTQDQYPVRDETTFTPALNWKHDNNFDSFYRMYFLDSTEALQENDIKQQTDIKQLNTGVTYHTGVLSTGLALQVEDNVTTNVDSSLVSAKYSFSYKKPLSSGSLQFNFNSLYDVRDQTAASDSFVQVFGEMHVLNSLDIVNLNREYIDSNTIVVSNENQTQDYTRGIDYRLILTGIQTDPNVYFQVQIQRLVSGSILDGETVLVNYSYDTGGTFVYERTSNNLSLNWSIKSSYDVYLRYVESDFNLQEGAPSINLNPVTSYTYGARADKPLINGIVLGGDAYQENRDEEVNSYIKQSVDAFIEMPLPNLTNLRITARRVKQDNENTQGDPDEDTDLESMAIRIQSRPWLRGSLSWESSYENDVGGTIDRQTQQHRLRFSWRIRQLSVGASINYGKELQDDDERERWEALISASRMF
ncbi:MAG: hypothetical protein KAU21_12090 [Gammaproteobacteria bacterium]|nr:hypothetical protein [Gammaproteobacteria bacterium]